MQPGGKAGSPLLVRPAHVREAMLTCADAEAAARGALLRMGYSITADTAPVAGAAGRVVGARDTGWSPGTPEAGTLQTVTVTITCSDAGAELDAVSDEGVSGQLDFPTRFTAAAQASVTRKTMHVRASEAPEQGLLLNVEPQRAAAARAAFGVDLPAAGITPVKVEIVNRTRRRYAFSRAAVELVTVQGGRAAPLSATAAAAQLGQSSDRAAAEPALHAQEIADAELRPGATLTGYLYFRAAAYQRARVVLTDVDSEEPEGFSVEF